MQPAGRSGRVAFDAITGAILATLCAVVAHVLGVQQLLRRPDLALYIPAAVLGALLGITRLRPVLWIVAGILGLFCIVIGYTPAVFSMSRPFIRRDPIPTHVDAIAVLGTGFTPDGLMRSETLDRLLGGLLLARGGLAPALLVSREKKMYGRRMVSDSADLATVTALANPSSLIVFVDTVHTTRDEALRMRTIARSHGWNTIAVVTSPMHSRRACATFEATGFKVVCSPAPVRGSGLSRNSNAEDRLRAFRSLLYESFATDSYRRRGWIR